MEQFDLIDEDYEAIQVAQDVARLLLRYPHITPQQIISLGKAIDALQRLPDVTPDVLIEYGVSYRKGTEKFEEMQYVLFRISEDEFAIDRGGSTYDSSGGGDSFSRPGWLVDIGGYCERDCELWPIESTVAEYVNLGGEIVVNDENE